MIQSGLASAVAVSTKADTKAVAVEATSSGDSPIDKIKLMLLFAYY